MSSSSTATVAFTAQTQEGLQAQGTLDAASPAAARDALRKLGLQVLEVSPANPPAPRRAGALDLVAFNAQLAHLLEAGVPLEQSLRLVAEEAGAGRLANGIRSVATELESGLDLPAAIAKHHALFPPLYGQLVGAGIKAGNLPGILASLSRHLEFDRQLRAMMWRASVYPLVVVAATGAVGCFFSGWVFPTFLDMFRQFSVRLPAITLFCLNYMGPISVGVLLLPGLLLLVLAGLRLTGNTGRMTDLLLRVPLLGRMVARHLGARWCDAAQLGLAAGLDLPAAMRLAGSATGSRRLVRDSETLCARVEAGASPGDGLRLDILPPVVPLALGAACRGGMDAPTALARLAATLREQAEYRMAAMQAWLVPLTIAFLGLTVGLMTSAMFLPMIAIMRSLMGGV